MKQIFRHKETILKLIVGIALILVVFHFVDFNELIDSVIHINPIYILAILALIFADRILMVCKWNPLLNALEIHAPFGLLLQLYIVSPVVGNFISGAGAELFRAYGVSKGRADVESVLASIVIERALGLFAMLFLVLISLFLASYLLTAKLTILSNFWWIPGMSALVLIVISLFFFYSKDLSDTLKVTLLKLPVIRNIYKIGVFIRKYRYHYRTIIIVFVLTFLEQLVPILMSDLLALSIRQSSIRRPRSTRHKPWLTSGLLPGGTT